MQGKGTRPFEEIELERETYGLTRQEIISVHLLVLSRIARGVRNEMEGVVSTGDRRTASFVFLSTRSCGAPLE